MAVEIYLLGDIGEGAARGEGVEGDVDAGDLGGAGVGGEEAEEAVDRGGFPGAVGAEQGVDLAGGDVEIEGVERDGGAELFVEGGGGEQGRGGVER